MTDRDEVGADAVARLMYMMDHPLTAPGSQDLAWLALSAFEEQAASVVAHFAGKVAETFGDGLRHDTLALPPGGGVAVWFVAWPGTAYEAIPQRYGAYFGQLCEMPLMLVGRGLRLKGFLEIDAYVYEDEAGSGTPALDIQYSFLPGDVFGGETPEDQQWKVILLCKDLCTEEERQTFATFMT